MARPLSCIKCRLYSLATNVNLQYREKLRSAICIAKNLLGFWERSCVLFVGHGASCRCPRTHRHWPAKKDRPPGAGPGWARRVRCTDAACMCTRFSALQSASLVLCRVCMDAKRERSMRQRNVACHAAFGRSTARTARGCHVIEHSLETDLPTS